MRRLVYKLKASKEKNPTANDTRVARDRALDHDKLTSYERECLNAVIAEEMTLDAAPIRVQVFIRRYGM